MDQLVDYYLNQLSIDIFVEFAHRIHLPLHIIHDIIRFAIQRDRVSSLFIVTVSPIHLLISNASRFLFDTGDMIRNFSLCVKLIPLHELDNPYCYSLVNGEEFINVAHLLIAKKFSHRYHICKSDIKLVCNHKKQDFFIHFKIFRTSGKKKELNAYVQLAYDARFVSVFRRTKYDDIVRGDV